MNKKIGFIIGGVGLALGGYAYWLKKQADKLSSLEYRFQNIRFDNIGLNNVKIQAQIVINNPSNVRFTVSGYDIDILYKGQKIANVKKSGINTTLNAGGTAALPIEVQLNPVSVTQNLLSVLLSAVTLGTETPTGIRYVGKISGRFGLIGFKNIDIDYTYQ
jgi:hypothetical protein